MQVITKELLKDHDAREDLQLALADILNGIRDDWLKADSHVGLSSVLDHNTQAIVDFIDIYNMIASFFVKKSDQIDWFKNSSIRFDGKSPMALIVENPHQLAIVRAMVGRMLNPGSQKDQEPDDLKKLDIIPVDQNPLVKL